MQQHLKTIKHALQDFRPNDWPALPGRRNHLLAGILVPLLSDNNWTCLLTQRKSYLREHGGEICFPGGKPDEKDGSLENTAVREAFEEVGLKNGVILQKLSSVPLYTSEYRLEPFLSLFPENVHLKANPQEVETIVPIPIRSILSLPYIDGKKFYLQERAYISPIFIPQKLGLDIQQPIFGGTAHVLLETIEIVSKAMGIPTPPRKETFDHFPFV